VTLIPNGVDPKVFSGNGDGKQIRNRWDLDGQFVATYAGALGMANDIPTILNAADRLREKSNITFLIVGDGKERPNLEAMVHDRRLNNVRFTGSVPKSDMPQILAASDACIATLMNIPMFKTTYPNKVFDYMAAGKPTILGIDGVIREVIEAARGGIYVPPGDAGALAAAVRDLERNRDKATKMGRSAREFVISNFNRAQHAKDFMELLRTFQ
jgi:glycosyltransferase involved in cell wall biosynthesis